MSQDRSPGAGHTGLRAGHIAAYRNARAPDFRTGYVNGRPALLWEQEIQARAWDAQRADAALLVSVTR